MTVIFREMVLPSHSDRGGCGRADGGHNLRRA